MFLKIPSNRFKLLLSIFFLLNIEAFVHAQDWTAERIDTTLKNEVSRLRKSGNVKEALLLTEETLEQALNINHKKGIKEGYYLLSNILSVVGRTKESIEYLDVLHPMLSEKEDYEMLARVYAEYGRSYHDLGLFQQSIKYFQQAEKVINDKWSNLPVKQKFIDYLYACYSLVYEEKGDTKQLLYYLKQAYKANNSPIIASRLAKFYTVYAPNPDSALYYIKTGDSLFASGTFDKHQQSILLRNKGRYYVSIQQYDAAFDAYKASVAISEAGGKPKDARDTYKLLYEAYALVNDLKNNQYYLNKYTEVNDSIQYAQRLLIEIPVTSVLQKTKAENQKREQRLYLLTSLGILVCIVFLIYLLKLRRRKIEKEREAALLTKKVAESDKKLQEKQLEAEQLHKEVSNSVIELEKKELQTQQLQLKVNESFNELVQLGRTNHPNFYARFKEIYPALHQKLTTINTNLRLSELTLCAYIYLDFSSKDISEYTFKSVRTIQTRKSDLRKKLVIDSNQDIYIWMKGLE